MNKRCCQNRRGREDDFIYLEVFVSRSMGLEPDLAFHTPGDPLNNLMMGVTKPSQECSSGVALPYFALGRHGLSTAGVSPICLCLRPCRCLRLCLAPSMDGRISPTDTDAETETEAETDTHTYLLSYITVSLLLPDTRRRCTGGGTHGWVATPTVSTSVGKSSNPLTRRSMPSTSNCVACHIPELDCRGSCSTMIACGSAWLVAPSKTACICHLSSARCADFVHPSSPSPLQITMGNTKVRRSSTTNLPLVKLLGKR